MVISETGTEHGRVRILVEEQDAEEGCALGGWLDGRVLPAVARRLRPVTVASAGQCVVLNVPET